MPKSKAEIMRELRARRKEQGLVEFREWVTLEQRERLAEYLIKLKQR